MCRCVLTLFSHFFDVPVPLGLWRRKQPRRKSNKCRNKIFFPYSLHSNLYFVKNRDTSSSATNAWDHIKDMESNYDEDLNVNIFFQQLQHEYTSVFEKAVNEGWVICVPRSGSFSRGSLLADDFLGHILVPSEELPATHFRTLTGKEVRLCNRVLTVDYDIAKPCTAHILFEETFYTEDSQKYRIWCVERILERSSITSYESLPTLTNLRECVDFLWTEILNKEVLEELDNAVKEYQQTDQDQLEDKPLQTQRDLVAGLYAKSLRIVLRDSRLREKTTASRHFLNGIKVAVETYVLYGLRNLLPKYVSACTAFDDACLNKTIKNLHELQLRDLGVRSDLYGGAVRGKLELARLDGFATVLGKIGCLKRAVHFASQGESSVSSDDLLPVLIFLVIRAGLPNWIAQLTFIKQFRFSSTSEYETDEAGFLVTSLEAAVEHIKSGMLTGSVHPEADGTYEYVSGKDELEENRVDEVSISHFFDQVKHGNTSEVERILSKETIDKIRPPNVKLCHPLCCCESCEKSLARDARFSLPTVNSRDDRGLTALHIAALYGQANMVDLLISHGSNVDEVDADGTTALHCSAARGHQNTLLLLLHADADPRITDAHGNTVLHLAADNGHEACVKAILYFLEHTKCPIDPNSSNTNGDTPLHYSSKWGYTGIVEILLEHGAQPRAVNRRGQTPLVLAHSTSISKLLETAAHREFFSTPRLVPTQSSPAMTQSLKTEKQFEPPYSTERLRRIERLLSAISVGDLRLAYYYLGLEGPDQKLVQTTAPAMCHPLCNCEQCTLIEEVPEEHQRKPALGINSRGGDGQTALHIASATGRAEFVQLLLDAGAKLGFKTKSRGQTPLHFACLNGRLAVTKILLNSGECDVNVKDNFGDTPLHLASRTGNAKLVELLVRHGANPKIRNSKAITALEEAEEKVMVSIARILNEQTAVST
ncbi:ankyrin repeat domain-containing protein 27-like [Neodiprion pinetum]|uniref:ankyrin repeat domain-containing protein 27-like n=1 Tax=Neodiprion pinetum TaxID=441929 RepID=UPI001EE10B0D|nr:ankyrin repeat domain-containing protein 27-like [Neodiprion pinetum]